MHERVEHVHQRVLVVAQQLQRHLARDAEHTCRGASASPVSVRPEQIKIAGLTFDAADPQAVDEVRRQAEGHPFRCLQRLAALE